MDLHHWFLFMALCLTATFSPGPGVLLAVSNAVTHGPRQALISSTGNTLGIFVVATATVSGLGLLFHTSAGAGTVLKVAGAAYLIYLGVRQWRHRGSTFALGATPAAAGIGRRRLFVNGLMVALSNPKSVLFFSAVFPQFMPAQAGGAESFVWLTSTFAACSALSHLTYVALAGRVSDWFRPQWRARVLNRSLGVAFIGMGLGIFKLSTGRVG